MRYLLLLYGEPVRPETLTPGQWQAVMEAHTTFHRELTEAGALVDSSPLAPPGEARTVQIRRGERMVVFRRAWFANAYDDCARSWGRGIYRTA